MIRTKEDLKYYMEQDRLALHMDKPRPSRADIPWRYEIVLRKLEYYHNLKKKGLFARVVRAYYRSRHHRLSEKYFTLVSINTCGPGLSIAHMGMIRINAKAKIGKNLRVQTGVIIGGTPSKPGAFPVIGDNVYIGAGAKVFGGVKIADRVAIGANAVVVKDILKEGTTHAGVPAKKISDHSSENYIDKRVFNKN